MTQEQKPQTPRQNTNRAVAAMMDTLMAKLEEAYGVSLPVDGLVAADIGSGHGPYLGAFREWGSLRAKELRLLAIDRIYAGQKRALFTPATQGVADIRQIGTDFSELPEYLRGEGKKEGIVTIHLFTMFNMPPSELGQVVKQFQPLEEICGVIPVVGAVDLLGQGLHLQECFRANGFAVDVMNNSQAPALRYAYGHGYDPMFVAVKAKGQKN
ncbi:hypothetical protein HYU16_03220 [Candidatus Woesearchaeota archaeon]|nr:hypothetical protein [Candidatus Woesearchaeota archaeon]